MNIGTILIATAMMLSAASAMFFIRSKKGTVVLQINAARRSYYAASALILFSVIMLLNALLNNEFQYSYVYNNSAAGMHLVYKIAALWAGSEGSYLIWTLMLNLMGLYLISRKVDDEDILLSVTAFMQALMLIVVLVKSPFVKVWVDHQYFQPGMIPSDGQGMNPLLMDPWMVAHPPVLFLGYASASIIFAYAVTALIRKEYDSWIEPAYKWLIFSTFTLGLGIFMGGYWAYTVLGWGGYWGWDPVENSSLVPWIVSIALMHSMMLQKRKPVLKKTNIGLALIYFILVFYSTFLTRSGVLSEFSVHSFQESNLKIYLGIMLALFIIGSLFIFIRRFRGIKSESLKQELFNLENMTVFGIIVLLFYSFIILSGTSMPIITGLTGKEPVPVTANFYNNISVPMGIMLIVFIILSAVSSIKYSKFVLASACAVSVAFTALVNIFFGFSPVTASFTAVSFLLLQLMLYDLYTKGRGVILSSRTAHLGIAVMVTGIIISGYYSWTEEVQVSTGQTVSAGDVSVKLNGFIEGPEQAIGITIGRNNRFRDVSLAYRLDENLKPFYKEPYLVPGVAGDIYISPAEYIFSAIEYGTEIFQKGDEKDVTGLKVKFTGFDIRNMGKPDMSIYANLVVNGRPYRPGLYLQNDEVKNASLTLAGTDRVISLEKIMVDHEVVIIRIAPSAKETLPPDYAVLNVSYKRMIWLVWLGTIFISAGLILSMVRLYRVKKS
ncbi:MAG TPA: cytochrome c biogenesis protein CcsA [Spirochaetota bacterium]|nr:cytochrome c biogenesis protein CcsA [Spirochaetota bacterium]